jgi:hypothetical protein
VLNPALALLFSAAYLVQVARSSKGGRYRKSAKIEGFKGGEN